MLTRQQLPKYEFSREGYDKLVAERDQLDKDRVLAVEDLAKARSMGDLSENGYYKAAREKLSSIDSRIRRVKLMLKYAVVIEKSGGGVVEFGSKVKVNMAEREMEFEIVGKEEANPGEGKISKDSPIGQALMGRREGDKTEVRGREIKIISIE